MEKQNFGDSFILSKNRVFSECKIKLRSTGQIFNFVQNCFVKLHKGD